MYSSDLYNCSVKCLVTFLWYAFQFLVLLLKPDKVPVLKSTKTCTVSNIWTGSYATFVNVKETGFVYGFGLNNYSQLGKI